MAVFDLNGLKLINDTQGHEAGDACIVEASRFICRQVRHSPVFRIGGDEFVAILENRDYENREQLLAGFNRQTEENLREGREVVIACGLADYEPGADVGFHDVFSKADGQMYDRKRALKDMGAYTRE